MVVRRGRLVHLPKGFMLMAPAHVWPILTTPLLSIPGKLRLLAEYFVPRRSGGGDESLAEFGRRRLGREAFEAHCPTTCRRHLCFRSRAT